jgi:hypothetical protein
MWRGRIADVGDRRTARLVWGGMPQRISTNSRSLPALRTTGAG